MTDLPPAPSRKRQAVIRILVRVLGMALAIYVIFGALMYFKQRDFLYPGQHLASVGTPKERGIKELSNIPFITPDGLSLHGWFAPARDFGKPVILFFHGNGSNIAGFWPKAKLYVDKGFGVFLCEYRGYGGNPGSPTEEGLYNDAQGCLFALQDKGYGPWNLVYYGESLGSGVAVDLAVKHPPKALVLECPYSSVTEVAKLSYYMYPVDWLMRDRFDSIGKIGKLKSRLFIVHGESDGLIPHVQAVRLYDKAPQPKEFHSIKGGDHNDLYAFGAGDIIADWLGNRRLNIYVPTKGYAGLPSASGLRDMKEITVTTEDKLNLYAWFAPPREKDGKVIVYFHGNMGNLANLAKEAKFWTDQGYGLYLCEYRGYGGNMGNPSEEGIYRDARAGIAWLEKQGYNAKQLIYYGYSLGASVAVQMATEAEPALLLLESSGSNALDVVNAQRPTLSREIVAAFVTERFENLGKVRKIHVPILFLHGEKDDVVPMGLARKLFDAANEPKAFKSFPEGGHGNLSQFGVDGIAAQWIQENTEKVRDATQP
jgi:fermentation-respiration switch protein FrsA (DUF1100 family)